MNNFKQIITTFAKQTLGGLAGEILLDDYSAKYNIQDLSLLSYEQQQKFIDAFLWGVFHRHMDKAKIDSIRLKLNLHFSLGQATETIAGMLGKDILLQPLDMKFQTFENFEKIINNLEDGIIVIPVQLSGYIVATLLLFIYRESAITLGNVMVQTMLGSEETDNFLTDMKQSAIKEFFNMVIPAFADTVANTLNQKILLSMPDTDITDSQAQIDQAFSKISFDGSANYGIDKIMSTPLGFLIDGNKQVSGIAFLLMENSPDIISDSLESTNIKEDDSLEKLDLAKIEIPKDRNRYKAIIEFLRHFMKDDPQPVVDNLMEDLGITSLNNVSVGLRRRYINQIMDDHFSNNSPKITEFIRGGCEVIFNIGSKIRKNKETAQDKADGEAIAKMMKHKEENK